MVIGETMAKMQKGTVDRISELPVFLLHDILLILGTKEAARASVLSKRWYEAWSSIPDLDFHPHYFKVDEGEDDEEAEDEKLQRYVKFINNTMLRYLFREYRIRKMYLDISIDDEKVENMVDLWICIALVNRIQELEFEVHGEIEYEPPEILFCARSLSVLTCRNMALPYYERIELVSLKHLTLEPLWVNEDMLERIISLCPLVELDITSDIVEPILIPWRTRVDGAAQSNLQACPLQKFAFSSQSGDYTWPWIMNVVALKNLKKLDFNCANITDDVVSKLTRGLVALETLVLRSCFRLKCVNISSISLKELRISDCPDFLKVEFRNSSNLNLVKVDAPNLLEFSYNCKLETSLSLIRVADQCNATFCPFMTYPLTTDWFVEVKEFLKEAKLFNSLEMNLSNSDDIVVVRDELRNIGTDLPYKIGELKLCGRGVGIPTKPSLVAFLDVLFWCCHPDVLSITTYLEDSAAKLILSVLKEKEQCEQDPLKSVAVEFIDRRYDPIITYPVLLRTRLRLSW